MRGNMRCQMRWGSLLPIHGRCMSAFSFRLDGKRFCFGVDGKLDEDAEDGIDGEYAAILLEFSALDIFVGTMLVVYWKSRMRKKVETRKPHALAPANHPWCH